MSIITGVSFLLLIALVIYQIKFYMESAHARGLAEALAAYRALPPESEEARKGEAVFVDKYMTEKVQTGTAREAFLLICVLVTSAFFTLSVYLFLKGQSFLQICQQ